MVIQTHCNKSDSRIRALRQISCQEGTNLEAEKVSLDYLNKVMITLFAKYILILFGF